MAYVTRIMYQAKCDGCGTVYEGDEFVAWAEIEGAQADAASAGWETTDDDRLLCPKCWPAEEEDQP